jgi:acetoacetyl-CoA synthetase
VLWTPPADAWHSTAAGRFATGCGFSDYASLHAWSVGDTDDFWKRATDFTGMRWHDEPAAMRTGGEMPDVSWFPVVTLN